MNFLPKLCLKRERALIGSNYAFIFNLLSVFSYFVGNHRESGHISRWTASVNFSRFKKLQFSTNFFLFPKVYGNCLVIHSQCLCCQKGAFNQSFVSSHSKMHAVSEGNNIWWYIKP